MVDDVVDNALDGEENAPRNDRYGINILLEHVGNESPVVVESNPTLKTGECGYTFIIQPVVSHSTPSRI